MAKKKKQDVEAEVQEAVEDVEVVAYVDVTEEEVRAARPTLTEQIAALKKKKGK